MSFPVSVPSVNAYAGDTLVFPTDILESDGETIDSSNRFTVVAKLAKQI